ncbi:MAG: glycosyltransferase family 39 protein [Planctomycetota bacterium]
MENPSAEHRLVPGWLAPVALAVAMVCVCAVGITWGLPSPERNRLYFRSPATLAARKRAIQNSNPDEAWRKWGPYAKEGTESPSDRSLYNALRTYHPDEYAVLKVLMNIRPEEGRLDPKFYHLGGAFLYPYGALLYLLGKAGVLHLTTDPTYYLDHPREIAAFYLVGRLLCAAFAVGTVLIVYALGKKLHSRTLGILGGLSLVVMPAFSLHSHFLYVDIPAAFWATLAVWGAVAYLENRKARAAVLAGLFAGLAVGTKVSTAPLVGVVALSLLFVDGSARKRLALAGASVLASLAAFAATNPFAVWHFSLFSGDVRSNAFVNVSFAPYLVILAKSAGPVLAVLLVVGVILALLKALKDVRFAPALIWVPVLFLVACLFGKRYARYLLPILPVAALLAALPAAMLFERRRTVSGWVVFLAGFLYNLAWTVSLLVVLRSADTRTAAGEALQERFPLGTRLAVTEVPWQYEMPAFDDLAYDAAVVGYDPRRLSDSAAELLITSEAQITRSSRDDPDARVFWKAFDENVAAANYRLLLRVERPQTFLGLPMNPGMFPEDMRYHNPAVLIYSSSASSAD